MTPLSSIFIFQGHISMSLWGFHKLLAFPGVTGYSHECQDEGKGGYFLQGRARQSQELGAGQTGYGAQAEMTPHPLLQAIPGLVS